MGMSANASASQPMSDLNTTPLIDVMLVLLVMFIITIPVATHSIPVDLPTGDLTVAPNDDKNRIVVDNQDRILWNGIAVDRPQLASLLTATAKLKPEPELQFEPEASASYGTSAEVLDLINRSGTTKFGFTGNEKYKRFGS